MSKQKIFDFIINDFWSAWTTMSNEPNLRGRGNFMFARLIYDLWINMTREQALGLKNPGYVEWLNPILRSAQDPKILWGEVSILHKGVPTHIDWTGATPNSLNQYDDHLQVTEKEDGRHVKVRYVKVRTNILFNDLCEAIQRAKILQS